MCGALHGRSERPALQRHLPGIGPPAREGSLQGRHHHLHREAPRNHECDAAEQHTLEPSIGLTLNTVVLESHPLGGAESVHRTPSRGGARLLWGCPPASQRQCSNWLSCALSDNSLRLQRVFKQFLRKRARILRALYRKYAPAKLRHYSPQVWWDEDFFTEGLSDRQTLSPRKNVFVAAYHYASVEMLILRHLRNSYRRPIRGTVCDLGSGAGHWIDFYRKLGATRCVGVDISQKAVDFLRERYRLDADVTIYHGGLRDILQTEIPGNSCCLVNAIGVMFHIVNDEEWEQTVHAAGTVLQDGGLLVVSGHFGWLDNLNVQVVADGAVVKRLRSLSHWKRCLRTAGFDNIKVYRNHAYLFIDGTLPENNVLVAEKLAKHPGSAGRGERK